MFMVLLSWQSHCESSPGSFDECICECRVVTPTPDEANQLGLSLLVKAAVIHIHQLSLLGKKKLSRLRHHSKGVESVSTRLSW